jgi:hypothetical protein
MRSFATEAEGDLSSPVDEGSSSTWRKTNRAAQRQRGADETGKIAFEPITPQIQPIEAAAVALIQSRRFGLLQTFMRAAHFIVRPFLPFRRRRKKAKGGASRADELRKQKFRTKKAAALKGRTAKKSDSGASSWRPPGRPTSAPRH